MEDQNGRDTRNALVVMAVFVILLAALMLLMRGAPITLYPGEELTRDGVAMMMVCKPYGWHGTPTHTARAYLDPHMPRLRGDAGRSATEAIASSSTTTTSPAPLANTATPGDRTGHCISPDVALLYSRAEAERERWTKRGARVAAHKAINRRIR